MNVLYEELETPEGEINVYISDSEGLRQNDQGKQDCVFIMVFFFKDIEKAYDRVPS